MFHSFVDEMQKIAASRLQGKIDFQGLPISIENKKGSHRSGKDREGNPWKTLMRAHYGYIRKNRQIRATGKDSEPIDVFVGSDKNSDLVVGIDLLKEDGSLDETKFFLGYKSPKAAIASFKLHYPKKWKQMLGEHRSMTMDEFKTQLSKDQKV